MHKHNHSFFGKNAIVKFLIITVCIGLIALCASKAFLENRMLRIIIDRLSADSRIAQVLVADVSVDSACKKTRTTIKFLEYDARSKPLAPKYFTFSGNIIQFQSMVIRFDDFFVKKGHPLKGKSAYIFLKAFTLNGGDAEVFEINKINEIPSGYRAEGAKNHFEEALWRKFWKYALEPSEAKKMGVKNAQIEAPGTKFIPGMLYTIKIEHDGGMRIDAERLPDILQGETIKP